MAAWGIGIPCRLTPLPQLCVPTMAFCHHPLSFSFWALAAGQVPVGPGPVQGAAALAGCALPGGRARLRRHVQRHGGWRVCRPGRSSEGRSQPGLLLPLSPTPNCRAFACPALPRASPPTFPKGAAARCAAACHMMGGGALDARAAVVAIPALLRSPAACHPTCVCLLTDCPCATTLQAAAAGQH